MRSATGGETIRLAPGEYGKFVYFGKNADWSSGGVTITSQDPNNPAVFTDSFDIREVHGLTISDIVFDADSLASSATQSRVAFVKSSDITLERIVQRGHLATAEEGFDPYDPAIENFRDPIEGLPRAIGLRVSQTEGFTLRDSDIAEVRVAMYMTDVSDVVIENNDFHAVREGINFTDIDGMEISNNTFRDFRSWLSISDPAYDSSRHEHPDMIQYWAANATKGIRDITIADNVFEMPQGSSNQSIFGHMRNPAPGVTAENFAILNNLIINGHPNAISISDVEGGLIAGNVILPNGTDVGKPWTPRLQVLGDSEDFHVVNNASVEWFTDGTLGTRAPGGLEEQNIVVENFRILGYGPGDDDYWGSVNAAGLLAQMRTDPSDLGINLSGTSGNQLLLGLGGDDRLTLRQGNDVATGGYGADRFIIDWASRGTADAHRITDLDFREGDQLLIAGWSGNGSFRIASQAELQSFAAGPDASLSGATLTLSRGSGPDLTVTFADGSIADTPIAEQPDPSPNDPGPNDPGPNDPGPNDPTPTDPEPGGPVVSDPPPSNSTTGSALNGSHADDIFIGTSGADKFLLRHGDDTATGGDGPDQFVLDWRYRDEGDSHTITDFDFAEGDTLILRGLDNRQIIVSDQGDLDTLIARNDVSAAQTPGGTALRFTDANGADIELRLLTTSAATAPGAGSAKLTGSNDDDQLTGGAGADTILLRVGSDTATGGAGPDTFVIDARYVENGDSHAITDLDFAEADVLALRFFDSGTITVNSAADLTALTARPDMAFANGVLTLTDPDGDVLTLSL